jgi:hypothetical protein
VSEQGLYIGHTALSPDWVHVGFLKASAGGWQLDITMDPYPGQTDVANWRGLSLSIAGRAVYLKQGAK